MAKKLALIGGGGHALSLLDILQPPLMVAGYVDFGISPKMPIPFLGNDSEFISPNTRDEFDILITMVSGPDCNLDTRAKSDRMLFRIYITVNYSPYGNCIKLVPYRGRGYCVSQSCGKHRV